MSVTSSSSTSNPPASASEVPACANSTGQYVFALGDNVRVELDVEIFKMMQEGHGEYDDQLLEV